jgi:hypothetical protein
VNPDYPPFALSPPDNARRRREPPRNVPPPQAIVVRRAIRRQIANELKQQILPLSRKLKRMSDEERKAVFYKLEHADSTIITKTSLSGTGLKPITEPGETQTLVIPREDNLNALIEKVEEFGGGSEESDGQVPHERLVAAIDSFEMGEPRDRLSETLLGSYDQLIKQVSVIFELEMISYRIGSKQQRRELDQIMKDIGSLLQGDKHGEILEHEEGKGTRRLVMQCSGRVFKSLVEEPRWQRRLYWFDSRPEFQSYETVIDGFNVKKLGTIRPPDENASVVCIVDSGITIGNPFLKPVTRQDLLQSFLEDELDNPADGNGHGSGMASLASYYALNPSTGAENTAKVWIAGARILDAQNRVKRQLLSKMLTEVVDTFVPLGVKIFNLSVNVINSLWNAKSKQIAPRRSWIARRIDQLSREFDIVFVISTGNIETYQVFDLLDAGTDYPGYFTHDDARILDPAQSALSLTVGAVSRTARAVGSVGTARAIAQENQPAPFTRCGPGINREVKPELVELSGNYLMDLEGGSVRENVGNSIPVASWQLSPALEYADGTSVAAARVTHKLGLVLRDLRGMGISNISAPLLKAFIVNSAQYPLDDNDLKDFNSNFNLVGPRHWLNVLGYGVPNDVRATECDQYSALFYYQGRIDANGISYFSIPVPRTLSTADRGKKRLTVTVVYSPEVQRWGLETYLGTHLKWRLFRGDVSREEVVNAMSYHEDDDLNRNDSDSETPQRGRIPVPKDMGGKLTGFTLRSKGTVQHDVFEWTDHLEAFSVGSYTLAVASFERWQRKNPPSLPFAVVVRLEDTTRSAQVYTEVRTIVEAEATASVRNS